MRKEEQIAEKEKGMPDTVSETMPKDLSFEDHLLHTLDDMIFEYANEADHLRLKGVLRGAACIETMHRIFGADNPELVSCREQYGKKDCLGCIPGMPGCFIAAHKKDLCAACEERTSYDEDTDSFVCRYGETDPMRGVAEANWRKSALIIAKQIISFTGLDDLDWKQVKEEEASHKGMMEATWDFLLSMRSDDSHSPSA